MGSKSRNKGAAAEREVAKILKDLLDIDFQRNLTQYQAKGGYDLHADKPFPFAIEIKRYARLSKGQIRAFWKQTCTQASLANKMPVLIYRGDRELWTAMAHIDDMFGEGLPTDNSRNVEYTVHMSMEAFCGVVQGRWL